jgi:hypothetical protein
LNINLSICINDLTDGLSFNNQNQEKILKVLTSKHNIITLLISNCKNVLLNELNDPYMDQYQLDDTVKTLIVNELEKCTKIHSEILFKVLFKSILIYFTILKTIQKEIEGSYYNRNRLNTIQKYEDQIASYIIKKVYKHKKQKIAL